ncbi:hypothetical protein Tco_0351908 [Tanacetum coccineum]
MWCLRHQRKDYSYGRQNYACPYTKPGTEDRGCGYFYCGLMNLRLHISSSSGSSTPPSYSPRTSTRPSYSPGSSRSVQNLGKAECSNVILENLFISASSSSCHSLDVHIVNHYLKSYDPLNYSTKLIKEKLKAARDRQKSYADNRRKPLEFQVGDKVLLKVSPWKGVMRFGKKGKLAPRYVRPFEILERFGPVAYRLRLPKELSEVHDTFHVSNLKKCLAEANLHVPLDEIKVDKTLHFVEKPVEIIGTVKLRTLNR